MKKILCSSIFILFCFTFSIFAGEVNVEDYGAIPNDGMDDAPAITSALIDIFGKGGGATIKFPPGRININSSIRVVPTSNKNGPLTFKGSNGTIIEVSVGPSNYGFYAGNLPMLTFEDLIFVGKNFGPDNPLFWDARYVIFSNQVNQTNINRCTFAGLAVKNPNAVVYFGNTDAKVTDSLFDSSLGQFPDGAVIMAEGSRGLTVSRSNFIDYAFVNDEYFSKSGTGIVGSWIKIKNSSSFNAVGSRRNVIEDSRFDEGANSAITAVNTEWIDIKGINVNVGWMGTARGITLTNVRYANIEQSWFGYNNVNALPALYLTDTPAVEVKALRFSEKVFFLRKFGTVNIETKFCPQCIDTSR